MHSRHISTKLLKDAKLKVVDPVQLKLAKTCRTLLTRGTRRRIIVVFVEAVVTGG